MEITLFKKNEINIQMFDSLFLYLYIQNTSLSKLKWEKYGNFKDLDNTKSKLDLLSHKTEQDRSICAGYIHEYELIKIICKKHVISRAYFKLYEMIYNESIILSDSLDCFFICEAPGGFIECISDIRIKKNKKFDFISVSIENGIKYDKYIDQDKYFYIDITDSDNMDLIINITLKKFPYGLDLITADGGFDIKYFNAQEILSSKLLLSEIYIALSTQKKDGIFIIKFFDMFTHNSMIYYFILCSFYSHVKIIKPLASRNSNSERYLICYSYLGKNVNFLIKLKRIIKQFKSIIIDNKVIEYTIIFPNFKFGMNNRIETIFNSKILIFNNVLLHNEIKAINESIKMSLSKDIYFHNLLIKIFGKNVPIDFIVLYKNILKTRIIKCINFLKKYNISISSNLYRIF